jgi:hypothetical protein
MTTSTAKAEPEFAKLKRRRQELTDEEAQVRKELNSLRVRQHTEEAQKPLIAKMEAIQEERGALHTPYLLAKAHAEKAAAEALYADESYRKRVRAFVQAWAAFVDSRRDLARFTSQRAEGLLSPLPSGLHLESEMSGWIAKQMELGALNLDDMSASLRILVEGKR